MAADDHDNLHYTSKLGSFLVNNPALERVTLDVPDDYEAGDESDQYEFFSWGLHVAMINAFKKGRFRELRFAHPRRYLQGSGGLSIYEFHNVDIYIEYTLLPEHATSLDKARCRGRYWVDIDERPADWVTAVQKIWLGAGYWLGFDKGRVEDEGTVLLLRRASRNKGADIGVR